MNNQTVAQVLDEVADLLEIQGTEVVFKIRAYRTAAEQIRDLGRDINGVAQAGELRKISGVGAAIAEKIESLLTTGSFDLRDRLLAEIPAGVLELLRIPDVGPRKARVFWQNGITSRAQLAEAARAGRVRGLPGMGAKTEQKLLANIDMVEKRVDRAPLGLVRPWADSLLAVVRAVPGVVRAEAAGSLRRGRALVGDIDLLAAADEEHTAAVMDAFVAHPLVHAVTGRGWTKCSVTLTTGRHADLRVLPLAQWGTLLQYFTGSLAHNIRLREWALEHGYSLSDQSLTEVESGRVLVFDDEAALYAQLGLPWIPPELREDRGELAAARAGTLPALLALDAIRGDLHMHTTWSDGKASLEEMAEAARARGLAYIAVTDHSHSLGVARGLTVERLREQAAEVAALNAKLGRKLRVLHGSEVEIRADGTLDFPDEVLAELDVVIASLHTGLRQPRAEVTARMLNAIRNPHVDIIAHPTGRLLPDREPADLDMEVILQAAAETGTCLEINADWHRLDLDDVYVKRALELGVRLVIGSDAHEPGRVGEHEYGIGMARRGWATAESIVNTYPLARLLKVFKG